MEIGATLGRGEKRNEMSHQHNMAAVERRKKGGVGGAK